MDTLLRLGILLAIFGSIFAVSQLVLNTAWARNAQFRAVNKRLSLIKLGHERDEIIAMLRKNMPSYDSNLPGFMSRPLHHVQKTIALSGSPLSTSQIMLIMLMVTAVVLIVPVVLLWNSEYQISAGVILLLLAIAICVGYLLPLMFLNMIADKRKKKVEEQFPIALDTFVSALRAGHPIASALQLLTTEMEDPIGSEFGLVSDEVSYGAELTDALSEMAERWDNEDIRMFVVSLSVQSETGGNLAEILQNLSEVIRARAALYRKVRALSSEGRMTGWILSVLPILAFIGLFSVNPEFYLSVAMETSFIVGFIVLMIMYTIGFLLIRKMIDIKV